MNRRTARIVLADLKIFLPRFRIQSKVLMDFWILQLQQIANSYIFWAGILDFVCNSNIFAQISDSGRKWKGRFG